MRVPNFFSFRARKHLSEANRPGWAVSPYRSWNVLVEKQDYWLKRVVRRYSPKDDRTQFCSLSFDIDLQRFDELVHGLPLYDADNSFQIPLLYMRNEPLINVDLDGPWKSQIGLLTAKENTSFSAAYILGYLESRLGAGFLRGIPREDFEAIHELVYSARKDRARPIVNIVQEISPRAYSMLDTLCVSLEESDDEKLECQTQTSSSEYSSWELWVRDRDFRNFIFDQLSSYVLAVKIPKPEFLGRVIIKIRHDVTTEGQQLNFPEPYDAEVSGSTPISCRKKFVQNLQDLSSGLLRWNYRVACNPGQSFHVSVEFPEGYVIEDIGVSENLSQPEMAWIENNSNVMRVYSVKDAIDPSMSVDKVEGASIDALANSELFSEDSLISSSSDRWKPSFTAGGDETSDFIRQIAYNGVSVYGVPSPQFREIDLTLWVRLSRNYFLIPNLISCLSSILSLVLLWYFAHKLTTVPEKYEVFNVGLVFTALTSGSTFVISRLFVVREHRLTRNFLTYHRFSAYLCHTLSLFSVISCFVYSLDRSPLFQNIFIVLWVVSLLSVGMTAYFIFLSCVPLWGYVARIERMDDQYFQYLFFLSALVVLVLLLGVSAYFFHTVRS